MDKKRDARRKALESSIKLMQEDDEGFEKFKKENTDETNRKVQQADKMFEERKKLENRIKKKKSEQNQLSSENQRIEEAAQNFKIYKEFLDSITNENDTRFTQWKAEKEERYAQNVHDACHDYINSQLESHDEKEAELRMLQQANNQYRQYNNRQQSHM